MAPSGPTCSIPAHTHIPALASVVARMYPGNGRAFDLCLAHLLRDSLLDGQGWVRSYCVICDTCDRAGVDHLTALDAFVEIVIGHLGHNLHVWKSQWTKVDSNGTEDGSKDLPTFVVPDPLTSGRGSK
jgi:hypothetical protein